VVDGAGVERRIDNANQRRDEAAKIAAKILKGFRKPFEFDSHELHITTSVGIAIYPNDGEDRDILMKNADIAMYRAKDKGRDNYQLSDLAGRLSV